MLNPIPLTIGQAIRHARRVLRPRMSQQDLADKLEVSRATVNMWENDRIQPDLKRIPALQILLRTNLTRFIAQDLSHLMGDVAELNGHAKVPTRSVPVYQTSIGRHKGGEFLVGTKIVARVMLPPGLASHTDLRMIRVRTDCMVPRYFDNEVVFIGGDKHPMPGDFVLVLLEVPEPAAEAEVALDGILRPALLRRLIKADGTKLVLEQFNPQKKHTVAMRDVHSVERVVPLEELVSS